MFGQSLLSAFGSAACTTDTDQLFTTDVQTTSVATYQLNNATTSIPSNTYPGTPSSITYAAGKFGNAAVFNGSSSKISIPSSFGIGNIASYSVSLWAKSNSNTTQEWIGGKTTRVTNNHNFTIGPYDASSQIRIFCGSDANDWVLSQTSSKFYDGLWHNYTFVKNGTYGYFYIDGVLFDSSNVFDSSTTLDPNGDEYIGAAWNGAPRFNGSIDQVRIFNTALPQSAVTALYNETTTTATYPYVEYEVANPNSIAYYKMSDATDQLGNYNGTATNVNFNTEGKFGFAGAFNGSSSYISGVPPLTNSNASFTISMWFKTSVSPAEQYLFGEIRENGTYDPLFQIWLNASGFLTTEFRNNSSSTSGVMLTDSTNYCDGNWHHVVSILTPTQMKMYIDGNEASSSPSSISGVSDVNNCFIGARNNRGSLNSPYSGKIDQIRIYDSALSAANVTALYNEIECPAVAVTNAFNTVLYTGNGGTQAVTGVGFKPDFSWVKNRNTAGNSHELADVVRGVDNTLNSNSTNAQYNNSTYQFNSFDTDGITVTDDAAGNYAVNGNNETYVAWNWKAPLANLSTGFNGSSSSVQTGIQQGSNPFTWSVWLKPNDITTSQYAIAVYNGANYHQFYIRLNSSNYQINCYNGTVYSFSTPAVLSQWAHLVLTYDGTGMIGYVNGVALGSRKNFTALSLGTQQTLLGGVQNTGNTAQQLFYNGSIDQVRIFNRAITATEVSDLYAEPAASNNTLNYPAGAGCIAAYPLQTDAVDLSGNYNGASSNVTFGQPGYLTGNTNGTIPSTVAANVDAGFSIVKYTGTGSNASFGHGLSLVPELVIVKRTSASEDWFVLYDTANTPPNYMKLNATAAGGTSSGVFPSPATSTVVNVGNDTSTNSSGSTYIAYAFHSIDGYSKIGSYTGTNAAGNFIYTGFQPRFLLTKRSSAAGGGWNIFDSTRGTDKRLYPNLSNAEGTDSPEIVTFNSNGFTFNTADSWNNGSYTYIYLAIA
jgi:hypothetical protein